MIIVAAELLCQFGVGVLRLPAPDVAVATAHIKNTRDRQAPVLDGFEEFTEPMQMSACQRVVGYIAEVLRRVVMGHIALMRSLVRGVVHLMVVALLIPTPVDGLDTMTRNFFNVLLHVEQIKCGVEVGRRCLPDVVAHKRKRKTGKG